MGHFVICMQNFVRTCFYCAMKYMWKIGDGVERIRDLFYSSDMPQMWQRSTRGNNLKNRKIIGKKRNAKKVLKAWMN